MTPRRATTVGGAQETVQAVEAMMRTSRVVSAAIAHSLAAADPSVTLPQLRVLVMVHDGGAMNMSGVANGLGVNPSNASRTCERLVRGGFLDRREDLDDRRNVAVTLTSTGRRLVESMLQQRRTVFAQVIEAMNATQRSQLSAGLAAFNQAAGQLADEEDGVSEGEGHLLRWLS